MKMLSVLLSVVVALVMASQAGAATQAQADAQRALAQTNRDAALTANCDCLETQGECEAERDAFIAAYGTWITNHMGAHSGTIDAMLVDVIAERSQAETYLMSGDAVFNMAFEKVTTDGDGDYANGVAGMMPGAAYWFDEAVSDYSTGKVYYSVAESDYADAEDKFHGAKVGYGIMIAWLLSNP